MIEGMIEALSRLISHGTLLAPVLALVAGVLTSVTPCALSTVPLIVGYVGGVGKNDTKRAFLLSLTFVAGTAITFTLLGVAASTAGRLMGAAGSWWYILLGALMVLMALQTWEVIDVIPSTNLLSTNRKKGYAGALLAGILGGLFSSPCATPVLVVLLGIVAQGGSLPLGMLLMLCYSIGHGFLAVAAGTSVGFVQKLSDSQGHARLTGFLRAAMGAVILLIALYMFYLGF